MSRVALSAEARLRAKSQLTLPDPIVQASGLTEGDRFLVEIGPDEPDTIRLHRIRDSYAGTLRDIYGDTEAYVQGERGSWRPG